MFAILSQRNNTNAIITSRVPTSTLEPHNGYRITLHKMTYGCTFILFQFNSRAAESNRKWSSPGDTRRVDPETLSPIIHHSAELKNEDGLAINYPSSYDDIFSSIYCNTDYSTLSHLFLSHFVHMGFFSVSPFASTLPSKYIQADCCEWQRTRDESRLQPTHRSHEAMLRNAADSVLTSQCLFPIPCAYTSLNKYTSMQTAANMHRLRENEANTHPAIIQHSSIEALFSSTHIIAKLLHVPCACRFVNTLEYLQHQQYAFFSSYIGFSFMYTTAHKRYVLWWTRGLCTSYYVEYNVRIECGLTTAAAAATCDANQALATASQIFNPKMKQIKLIRISTKVCINIDSVCYENEIEREGREVVMRTQFANTQIHSHSPMASTYVRGRLDWGFVKVR